MHDIKKIINTIKHNKPDKSFLDILAFLESNESKINIDFIKQTPMETLNYLANQAAELIRQTTEQPKILIDAIVSQKCNYEIISEFI